MAIRTSGNSDNGRVGAEPAVTAVAYEHWLARQPLSEQTRRAYLRAARQYLDFVARAEREHGDPLRDGAARDYAVRDFKRHLKRARKAKPSSINLALAAIDNLYRYAGLGAPNVTREALPQQAPRALEQADLRRFIRTVEALGTPRDQALAWLMVGAALRVGECEALDLDDVALSARRGVVTVREGKGDNYREVPLNAQTRTALDPYLQARRGPLRDLYPDEPALFLNRSGGRLSSRSIDASISTLADHAGIKLTPHVLRHTCITQLVRAGKDLVLVADLAGHKRLETTRRYALPSLADRESAMDAAQIDY